MMHAHKFGKKISPPTKFPNLGLVEASTNDNMLGEAISLYNVLFNHDTGEENLFNLSNRYTSCS